MKASIVLGLVFTLCLGDDPIQGSPKTREGSRPGVDGDRISFERGIRPIFSTFCYKCHGPQKAKGQLRLDTRARALRGGVSGKVILPGDSRRSRLIRLLLDPDDEVRMPRKSAPLPKDKIALLRRWIEQGAIWPDTGANGKPARQVPWAFRPLKRPDPPGVKDGSWCLTPIDRFILARLEAKGGAPNPVAAPHQLLRRAFFDLIGLPPTPEETRDFLTDDSPEAHEKLIDHLLGNPHYGERWARHWLDVARFAESHGFEYDVDRPNAWPYRDFVIKAFNEGMPYDRFVRWQLAGDEIEPENPLALMATGFLAAGVHNTAISKAETERTRYDELDDMLSTMGTAMLGLTLGCARCHNHKFDPIPTRDYYRLASSFTTTVRTDFDVNLDPEGYKRAREKFDREHAPLLEARDRLEKEKLPSNLESWARRRPEEFRLPRWLILDVVRASSSSGTTLARQSDGSMLACGSAPHRDAYTFVAHTHQPRVTAVKLDVLTHPSLPATGPGRDEKGSFKLIDFIVSAAPLQGGGTPVKLKLANPKATSQEKRGSVRAAIDGNERSGWSIDPKSRKNHTAVFEIKDGAGFEGETVLTFQLRFADEKRSLGRLRLSITAESTPARPEGEIAFQNEAELRALLAMSVDPPREILLKWFRRLDPGWLALDERVQDHLLQVPRPRLLTTMICSEGVKPWRDPNQQGPDFYEETYILKRGDPLQKQGVAPPGFLRVLMRAPADEKRWRVDPPAGWRTSYRRRSLANWITDDRFGAGHLLARVIVNRLWQHHVGQGIVVTPSDFGAQGVPPSHPDLLDWLAGKLIEGGWRLKPIHKLIMTSAVYRQSARFRADAARIDPDNVLRWRWQRRRLEAEIIRDSLLSVSGSLDRTLFGPGTLDEKQKRRSIYFTVKRSKLVPFLKVFDIPEPLQGIGRRSSTTIAPQALLILNSPLVLEVACAFAGRLAPEAAVSWKKAVRKGYRIALSRPPTDEELSDAAAFLERQSASYRAAGRSAAVGPALEDFCQVLLGLNELIYVE